MKKSPTIKKDTIYQHLSAQQKSGLSMLAYCTRHRIEPQTFYYWRKKYGKDLSSLTEAMTPSFIEMPVPSSNQPDNGGTIRMSHTTVEITGTVSSDVVSGLLEILSHSRVGEQC